MDRVILDLCGGTGAWSKPYADAGYDIRMIDINFHIDIRLLEFNETWKVHGILAAPPCTEFSFAKHFHGKGKYEHNFLDGLSIVDACLRAVVIYKPKWWALENPKGYLSKWLGEPAESFEPWQYGDKYQKRTCLWGDFKMPKAQVRTKPEGLKKFSLLKSKEIYPEYYGKYTRQERRAITPPGFAQAFYESNQ